MRTLQILLIALVSLTTSMMLHAQTAESIPKELESLLKPDSEWGWFKFREETDIDPLTFLNINLSKFGLSSDNSFQLKKIKTDKLGLTHYYFQQYFYGIPIKGAEVNLHTNQEGFTYLANGKIVRNISSPINPLITEDHALSTALSITAGNRYSWENQTFLDQLKLETGNPDTTTYPKGEIIYAKQSGPGNGFENSYKLCWAFNITMENVSSVRIYIDAITGEVLKKLELDYYCDAGTGITSHYGTKFIWTTVGGGGANYILKNDCFPTQIHTQNNDFSTLWIEDQPEFKDSNNNWSSADDKSGVTTFWCSVQTYEYFDSVHGRESWDGGGSAMKSYANASFVVGDGENALWKGFPYNVALFGYGINEADPDDDYNTLDIVGHEFAHGVTQNEIDLDYEYESGALSESFSDIFGEMVELNTNDSNEWLIGEDMVVDTIRSMSQPNNFSDPNTYLGNFWFDVAGCTDPDGENDNCGVHTNSGVQNFWYYLISEGNTGVNDFALQYEVEGLGTSVAETIVYQEITSGYLTSESVYSDARKASIQAAEDHYGSCSNPVIQVAKAWDAVGVGPGLSYYNEEACGTIFNPFGNITYTGIESVESGAYDGSCDAFVIESDNAVTFKAGKFIRLKPGFTAEAGSELSAYVNECSIAYYEKSESEQPENVGTVNENNNGFSVFPNPAITHTTLEVILIADNAITLEVLSIDGRTVSRIIENTELTAGNYTFPLALNNYPPGIYLLKLKTLNEEKFLKLIKQ